MIAAGGDGGLTLVTQHDHAALAADLLALWRVDGIAERPRRDTILWAAREHDNGWQESDAAPLVDATGRVQDYRSLAAPLRREIWLRGCRRYADREPLGSWLIVEHGLQLHRRLRDDPDWSDFFDSLDSLQTELVEQCPEIEVISDAYR